MSTGRSGARSVLRRLRIGLLPVPTQTLGLTALVAVLGAALASVPLVLGSAEEGAWQLEQARHTATELGATLSSATLPDSDEPTPARIARALEFDDVVTRAIADAGLAEPVFQARLRVPLSYPVPVSDRPVRLQLVARDGATDHVDIVAGQASGAGVLVPQRLADAVGIGPGGTLPAESDTGLPAALPVAGVYAEPTAPLPAFWEGQRGLFLSRFDPESGGPVQPPAAVLVERELLVATAGELQQDLFLQWFVPLDPVISIDRARTTADRLERLQLALTEPGSPAARIIATENYPRLVPDSVLPESLDSVDRTVDLLEPPVRAVGIGGAAAALVLVGAWAGQRVRRRHDELESLVARGLSPIRAAGQAVRESVLPVLVGTGVGGCAAWLLVRTAGPSAEFPAGTEARAAVALGICGLAALVAIGAVTAVSIARMGQLNPGPLTQWLARLPWLAVTAAVTVVAAVPVLTRDSDGRGVDLLALVVPLLVTVVAAGAVTAVLPHIGRGADARLRRLPPAAFLAVRRVLAASGAARLVVVTTALSMGLVVYAGALADSSVRTVAVKAAIASPSDVVVPLLRRTVEDGPLPARSTVVGTEEDVTLVPGEFEADVLVVHPEELAGVARWDPTLADRSLAGLMSALTDYDGDRVPVLVAGLGSDAAATGSDLTLGFGTYYSMPIEVVGRAAAFPGQGSQDPLLVADWERVSGALEGAGRDPLRVLDRQVWADGETTPVLDSLSAAGYAFEETEVRTADAFTGRPEVRAQSWSLAYLRAVSLAAGLLGVVGIAMHAVAQQRRRVVAGLLLARMGMSRRSADTATALEIGLLTGIGTLVAVAVALPASGLVLRLLDPVPTLPPDPSFTVPAGSITAVVIGVVLVTAGSALLAGRAARRAIAGEVLRGAP